MAKNGKQTTLTDQQLTAIECLIAGQNQGETAAAVAVDRVTIWRWQNEPDFQAELNKRRADVWEANAERIRRLTTKAVDTLEELMDGEDPSIRLRAASLQLKAVGLVGLGKPGGSTDPAEIRFLDSLNLFS